MSTLADLYNELKGDVVAVADPLLEHSQKGLQARDDFLPHAAVLTPDGRVSLIGAMTGSKDGAANAAQVLSMLHKGLHQMAREKVLAAIGVAENAAINRDGQPMRVVRIQFEHERGLAVALMLPYLKNGDGTYAYGEAFVLPTEPELKIWPSGY